MEIVSPKYQEELDDLAYRLTVGRHIAELRLPFYAAEQDLQPPTLKLCDPIEDGWLYTPPEAA